MEDYKVQGLDQLRKTIDMKMKEWIDASLVDANYELTHECGEFESKKSFSLEFEKQRISEILEELRSYRDQIPFGEKRSLYNQICDRFHSS